LNAEAVSLRRRFYTCRHHSGVRGGSARFWPICVCPVSGWRRLLTSWTPLR